jgi:hypothetical protein
MVFGWRVIVIPAGYSLLKKTFRNKWKRGSSLTYCYHDHLVKLNVTQTIIFRGASVFAKNKERLFTNVSNIGA